MLAALGLPAAVLAVPPVSDPFDDPVFREALPPLDAVPSPPTPSPLPPPPGPDPELAVPLPPLAASDVTPRPTQEVREARAPELRYRVSIAGLREVDLESSYRDVAALFDKGRSAANAAQVDARATEDRALIARLLRSQGYYDGTATVTVGPVVDERGELPVAVVATAGKRYVFGDIVITGAPPEPTGYAVEALNLKRPDPIVADVVEAAEARVALRLPERGYPFAAVGARSILLGQSEPVGDYTLPLDAGPKARFGALTTSGDPVFGLRHLNRFPRFASGDLYDSRMVDDLRQALIGTSLFSTIAVAPVRTGVVEPDGTERVDLDVRQVRGPARSLQATAGYSTGEGVIVQGSWTHRNLFPPEGALTVGATLGTQQQAVNALFRRSNAGQRDRILSAGLGVARQRFDAYAAETINLNATLARVSTPIWQKRWTYSVGLELVGSRETTFDVATRSRPRDTYLIAALPLQLGYDRSNSLLDPTRGFRLTARVSPEAQKNLQRGFGGYARTLFEGSAYFPVTDSIVLAGRARIGSIVGIARDDVAPSRRLYAGGGGSVRGYGFQQLGPKDATGRPIGGRSLTEFSLEARYRFGNFGVVPFFDAGRVGEASSPSFSGMRYGAGIGGRYYTNFGPLRIDVATPIGRRPGEPLVAVYLSIGQAF